MILKRVFQGADEVWKTPLPGLRLSRGEIHLWRSSLDLPLPCVQRLRQSLSADERTKAERFHFEKDRSRFIAGAGILRAILGNYSGIEPGRIGLCYGGHGKPQLSTEHGKDKIYFNRSSSEDMAIYGFSRDDEIGVDLEYIRDLPEMNGIATRILSEREIEVFRSLPDIDKREAFFSCWTRKEAWAKAIGGGLAWPLDRIEVTFRPGEPARLLSIKGDPITAPQWSINDLKPAPGYAAAFAVKGSDWKLRCWQWPDRHHQAFAFDKEGVCQIPTN